MSDGANALLRDYGLQIFAYALFAGHIFVRGWHALRKPYPYEQNEGGQQWAKGDA